MSCLAIVSNGNYKQNRQNLHMWQSKPNLSQNCVRTPVSKKNFFQDRKYHKEVIKSE